MPRFEREKEEKELYSPLLTVTDLRALFPEFLKGAAYGVGLAAASVSFLIFILSLSLLLFFFFYVASLIPRLCIFRVGALSLLSFLFFLLLMIFDDHLLIWNLWLKSKIMHLIR